MRNSNRREFLADVGRGMLVASLGSVVAADLEVAPAWASEGAEPLTFGTMEPLVELMQETPVTKLLPKLVNPNPRARPLHHWAAPPAPKFECSCRCSPYARCHRKCSH